MVWKSRGYPIPEDSWLQIETFYLNYPIMNDRVAYVRDKVLMVSQTSLGHKSAHRTNILQSRDRRTRVSAACPPRVRVRDFPKNSIVYPTLKKISSSIPVMIAKMTFIIRCKNCHDRCNLGRSGWLSDCTFPRIIIFAFDSGNSEFRISIQEKRTTLIINTILYIAGQ